MRKYGRYCPGKQCDENNNAEVKILTVYRKNRISGPETLVDSEGFEPSETDDTKKKIH
jgi:hypothetical protein